MTQEEMNIALHIGILLGEVLLGILYAIFAQRRGK